MIVLWQSWKFRMFVNMFFLNLGVADEIGGFCKLLEKYRAIF